MDQSINDLVNSSINNETQINDTKDLIEKYRNPDISTNNEVKTDFIFKDFEDDYDQEPLRLRPTQKAGAEGSLTSMRRMPLSHMPSFKASLKEYS